MKSLMLSAFLLSAVISPAFASLEETRGNPIFGDSFDAVGTFAENWESKGVKSAAGVAALSKGGYMKPRVRLPEEFVAEAVISLPEGVAGARGGFMLDGYYFQLQSSGIGFVVWKLPGEIRSSGKYEKIEGYTVGEKALVMLSRCRLPGAKGVLKYSFEINGRSAGDFIAPEPDGNPDLSICGYKTCFSLDDFLVSSLRKTDDSPNMVFNSGFEHVQDSVPPYYGLHGDFDFISRAPGEYISRYLKRFSVDSSERNSGNRSLRVEVNNASRSIVIAPWQTGTVKGRPGVFSVYMKASVDNLPVEISLAPRGSDGRRIVSVGRRWQRYEVTRQELPGKGVYSPVAISPVEPWKRDAVLWIDDLQCELVELPPDGKFDPERIYASRYRPSSLDETRFGEKEEQVVPPCYTVPQLPEGIKADGRLDEWKRFATEISDFWVADKKPSRETRAYVACDSCNLYIGVRSFGENPRSLSRAKEPRDTMIYVFDGLEIFLKPSTDGDVFHLMAGANGDRCDIRSNNIDWNGSWKVEAEHNSKVGAVDYFLVLPFADFVSGEAVSRWQMNLCRNDRSGVYEAVATAKTPRQDFKIEKFWPSFLLPSQVVSKFVEKSKPVAIGRGETVIGRLDYYMNENEAAWRVYGANGSVREIRKPMSQIPFGTNVVSFTLEGKTYSDTVVRLPFRENAVQINRWARCVVKDGRNELVTALCTGVVGLRGDAQGRAYANMVALLKECGFKYCQALIPSWSRCREEARAYMDAVSKGGLKYLNWCDFGRKFGGGDRRDDLTTDEMVKFFRPYENCIMTNLVIDEPELFMSSDETRKWLESMKKRYPYLPVQMNNTVMGIPSGFAGLKTDILMLDDYLTNTEGRTVDSIVQQVDIMRAVPGGRPCWYFIVSDNMTLHYRNPTYAEQIAQSWGAVCAGCTGLSWYIGFPSTEGSFRAMVDVNREVQSLADVILSEEICADSVCDRPKNEIRHFTRRRGGAWYVLSCNISPGAIERASFSMPDGAPENGVVEVLFENRSLPLKGGVFSDSFAGYSRHLYRISSSETEGEKK